MTREFIIFFVCLGFGGAAKLLYYLITLLERKLKFRPATFVLDFVFAALLLSALAVFTIVYNNGFVTPYMIVSMLLGYFMVRLILPTVKPKQLKKP